MPKEPASQPSEPQISVPSAANLLRSSEDEIRELSRRHVLPPIRKDQLPMISTVQRFVVNVRERLHSVHLAGRLIDKSPQWIRHLIAEGFIEKRPDGKLEERAVFLGYIRWLTDNQRRASKVQAESRVRDARAREIELRIAEREGRLIELADMEAVVDEVIGLMRSELAGLPARVTRDLVLRRTIETAVNEILARVADTLEQARQRLQSGDPDPPAISGDATRQVGGGEPIVWEGEGNSGAA